jgi:hypothetical protein
MGALNLREVIFNLFLFGNEEFINELGVATHTLDGDDASKLKHLRASIDKDSKIAQRFQLGKPLRWKDHFKSVRMGRELVVFEEIFIELKAPKDPLLVLTSFVNGQPRIEAIEPVSQPEPTKIEVGADGHTAVAVDWLTKYTTDQHIDLPRLIDDDYFKAIKLLFNAQHYVSAAKLLMSFIDTAAFLDLGDASGNFVTWLERYADLSAVGITPVELWEFRNGLLHMTNANSRAVARGRIRPLYLYVGGPPGYTPPATSDGAKDFNFKALLEAISIAIGNWIKTYNDDRDKFPTFVERYDLVVSDSRTFKVML